MPKLNTILEKFNFRELIMDLKITFIYFFLLRICLFLNLGTLKFFTTFTMLDRLIIYLFMIVLTFIFVYFQRYLALFLLNFLIGILLFIFMPIVRFGFCHKLVIVFILYPAMFSFWLARLHPLIFLCLIFLLLSFNLKFLWLIFMVVFLTYIYEIILNPFYPLKSNIYEALVFYEHQITIVFHKMGVKNIPKLLTFGINYQYISELYQKINIAEIRQSVIPIIRDSYVAKLLNKFFRLMDSSITFPVSSEVYFLNFFHQREFLVLYILVARFYYFDQFFSFRKK